MHVLSSDLEHWACVARISSREALSILRRGDLVVLPLGSVEAHGPHLPLGTDTIILKEILRRTPGAGCLLAPMIEYTPINYWKEAGEEQEGALLDVPPGVWSELLAGITRSFGARGARNVVYLTWHDTADFLAAIRGAAALAMRAGCPARLECIRLWPIAKHIAQQQGLAELEKERHAARIETGIMLACAERLVGSFKEIDGGWTDAEELLLHGLASNAAGVYGSVAGATAKEGQTILDAVAVSLESILRNLRGTESGL